MVRARLVAGGSPHLSNSGNVATGAREASMVGTGVVEQEHEV